MIRSLPLQNPLMPLSLTLVNGGEGKLLQSGALRDKLESFCDAKLHTKTAYKAMHAYSQRENDMTSVTTG